MHGPRVTCRISKGQSPSLCLGSWRHGASMTNVVCSTAAGPSSDCHAPRLCPWLGAKPLWSWALGCRKWCLSVKIVKLNAQGTGRSHSEVGIRQMGVRHGETQQDGAHTVWRGEYPTATKTRGGEGWVQRPVLGDTPLCKPPCHKRYSEVSLL